MDDQSILLCKCFSLGCIQIIHRFQICFMPRHANEYFTIISYKFTKDCFGLPGDFQDLGWFDSTLENYLLSCSVVIECKNLIEAFVQNVMSQREHFRSEFIQCDLRRHRCYRKLRKKQVLKTEVCAEKEPELLSAQRVRSAKGRETSSSWR